MENVNVLDVVTLLQDLPQAGLRRGQVGTVVERLGPEAYEVEFVDNNGATYALLPLKAEQLLPLRYEPARSA